MSAPGASAARGLLALADLDAGPGRRLLEATVALGFSEPVAREGLRAELDAWRAPGALEAVLAELPPALDPARLPGTVLVLAARTLPASAMRQVLLARLLGARVLLKPASGQEALAEALAAADPAIAPRPFASADAPALDRAIGEADAVVVLGSDATVRAVRARVPPGKAFVGYGHRLSVAVVHPTGGPGDDAALAGLARDLLAWDQAGCLSPQVAWTSGDPRALARGLAAHVAGLERTRPMALPPEAIPARRSARTLAEMAGVAVETDTALLLALDLPGFRPSPGWRTLWVLPWSDGAIPSVAPHLTCVGYAGPPERAPALPGVRTCPLGTMQRPPLDWPHDGRPNLPPMLLPTAS